MAAYEINEYTGNWQRALTPGGGGLEAGDILSITEQPDGREWDDFRRCMRAAGLRGVYLETAHSEGTEWDVYALVDAGEDDRGTLA